MLSGKRLVLGVLTVVTSVTLASCDSAPTESIASAGQAGPLLARKQKPGSTEPAPAPAPAPEPAPAPAPAPAPTGATPSFSDGFETGARSALQNGYGWTFVQTAGGGDAVGVVSGFARTGSYSMKFTYGGNVDRCDDAFAEQRFTLGENLPEVWFEYYVFLPKGTEGVGPMFKHRAPSSCSGSDWPNATNNKFFVVWADSYSTDGNVQATIEYERLTDTTSYIRVTGMDGDPRGMEATGTKHTASMIDPATRGRWVRMRVHVKTASAPGAYNGMVEVWRDDTKIYSLYNFDIAYAGGKNYFRNGYIMGWANSGFDQTTSVYLDDFKIYRSAPGW